MKSNLKMPANNNPEQIYNSLEQSHSDGDTATILFIKPIPFWNSREFSSDWTYLDDPVFECLQIFPD